MKQQRILDGALAVLARDGISGVSMRAVAREAGVSLGLTNYYFEDKTSLIAAALRRIGEQDAELVSPVAGLDPEAQLRHALRRVVEDDFLRPDYLALRLQLWSLAPVDGAFATINHNAQLRYRRGLEQLISTARPDLDLAKVARRATDILIVQNGIWLTSMVIADRAAVERSVRLCEAIAFDEMPILEEAG